MEENKKKEVKEAVDNYHTFHSYKSKKKKAFEGVKKCIKMIEFETGILEDKGETNELERIRERLEELEIKIEEYGEYEEFEEEEDDKGLWNEEQNVCMLKTEKQKRFEKYRLMKKMRVRKILKDLDKKSKSIACDIRSLGPRDVDTSDIFLNPRKESIDKPEEKRQTHFLPKPK